ncbi:alcohol dehydrogenase-like regulatory protein ErcA [Desulfofustis limnaeus]|uniref:Alcohol dehydrogenase n=1 Tax=Desulfofustis limnaeus TaxID=2740163 RepID=A0ABM7W5R0_9BACT|nr:alcohol dehydrogenase-like regulatory protein ErcA [Desulfofustis limnaeus]BDD86222.1 alcohol dehydrogenase [Desulfofustis limnaeus]
MNSHLLFNLRKFLAPEIVYGAGSLELAGRHASNLGASRVLLVSDPGVLANGWAGRVETSMKQNGIDVFTFADISPNPRDHEVMAGADRYRDHGCDLIVAVGGGSPMDCAKGIGVVVTNGGVITEYEGVDEVGKPVPPLLFIPTTAGTSADVSQFAIISDTSRQVKIAIISKMVIPDVALVDPLTTTTMPVELTAATGMDALCHAFEAAVSTASSPLTDMAAEAAIKLIFDNLVKACHDLTNPGYRDKMMMASLMAGLAFSNASLGIVHAMAHALGGRMDLPHGECNALLLEKAILYNYPFADEKYERLGRLMGLQIDATPPSARAQAIASSVARLRGAVGINQRLGDRGVRDEHLPRLADMAFRDPCLATNPRESNPEEIAALYRQNL